MPISRPVYVHRFAHTCSWPEAAIRVDTIGSRVEAILASDAANNVTVRVENTDRFLRLEADSTRDGAIYQLAAQWNRERCPLVMTGPTYEAGTLLLSRSYHLIKIIEIFPPETEGSAFAGRLKIVSTGRSSPWGIEVDLKKLLAQRGHPVRADLIGDFTGLIDCTLNESEDLVTLQGANLGDLMEMPRAFEKATLRLSRCPEMLEGARDIVSGAAAVAHGGGLVFSGATKQMLWDMRAFAPLALCLFVSAASFLLISSSEGKQVHA